ncbi:MAG: MazG family protein [Chlamydiota bacterium]
MNKFQALMDVATRLNGPEGCPWDHTQTFLSLQPYVLEEAYEVIEAVDANDDEKIVEELGDLLYTVVFYAKIAEKEGKFTIDEILDCVREKLIRRHPHVFTDLEIEHVDEIMEQWEKIKKEEKGKEERHSVLDGIPKNLPTLFKAQKVLRKMRRAEFDGLSKFSNEGLTEESVGKEMLDLVLRAEDAGIDAESALRRMLSKLEEEFRSQEAL